MTTRPLVETEQLRLMLRSAYGPGLVPTDDDFARPLHREPTTEEELLVRLSDGQQVVVRLAPDEQTPLMTLQFDQLLSEVEALQTIAEHTDVPVPAMHHHDDSYSLVDREWFAREYLPGRPCAVEGFAGCSDGVLHQLGGHLRALHGIQGDGFGRFLQPVLGSWQDALAGIVEDALLDSQRLGTDLGVDPDRVHGCFLDQASVLDAVEEPVFCLWRVGPREVLVDGAQLSGIVRPSTVIWGDPLMEAPFAHADAGLPAALLRGYGRGPLDEHELHRRRIYDLFDALVDVVTRPTSGSRAALEAAMARLGHRR